MEDIWPKRNFATLDISAKLQTLTKRAVGGFMRSIVLLLTLLCIAQPALAQVTIPKPPPPRTIPQNMQGRANAEIAAFNTLASGNPMQQREAKQAVAAAGVECDMVDAGVVKDGHHDGHRAITYEVACKNGLGWIIATAGDKISAFDCLALKSSAKLNKTLPTCHLLTNADPASGLGGLIQKGGRSCTPQQGEFLGGGGEPAISRYEVLCTDGKGYVIDAPQPRSTAQLQVFDCADLKAAGMSCILKSRKR